MFFRILKKDLKRKKTMNIVLLLFMILASMFVASSLNNVITVATGTDYYMDLAGVKDFTVITMGQDSEGSIEKCLVNKEFVQKYEIENVVYGAQGNVFLENGDEAETKNSLFFQAIEDSKLTYFDMNNEEINFVEENHVYVSADFLKENELVAGDQITIKHSGTELKLVLAGKVKDALLGSPLMGNERFFMNKKDLQKLLDNKKIANNYKGEIGYIQTDDIKKVSACVSEIQGVAFDGPKSTIKRCYIMNMVVAFSILILSVCLILISFVVLKFSINFTIKEEFREIGVMKAIGLSNNRIRGLYIIKYFMLAVVGSLIGLVISIPFGNFLMKSVSESMVLGNSTGYGINVAGAVIVVLLIALFSFRCTWKVNKLSPLDAIRSGQTGESFKKKTSYRIGSSHVGTNIYLALNDIVNNKKRFVTIVIPFIICTLFVLMMVNTTETMESPNLVETFGTKSDLYVTDVQNSMEFMSNGTREKFEKHLEKESKRLEDEKMPSKMCVEVQYKYKVLFDDNEYVLSFQQGINTKCADYKYSEGVAPCAKNEIAITKQISETTGAKIGDTLTIDFGTKKIDCIVTAYFQTMNQLGQLIRLHEDAPTDFKYISGIMQDQITFTDNPDEKEIIERQKRIKKMYDNDDVKTATEYCTDCIGVVDTMKDVQWLVLGITIIVAALVTILMEYSFIADEKTQIAILKAIGFRDGNIIRWHTYRFVIISCLSVVIAAILSIPTTKLCITPIFGMMGATDVEFKINPMKVFLLYPGLVLTITIILALISSLHTKQIICRDTSNIE